MSTHAVLYSYTAGDAAEAARDEHRPAHRAFLKEQADAGRLLASGPFGGDGAPGALLVFEADSVEEVNAILDADPFQQQGLVAMRTVRPWNVVIGSVG